MNIRVTTDDYSISAAMIKTPNKRGYFWGAKDTAICANAEMWYFGHYEIENGSGQSRLKEKTAAYIHKTIFNGFY